jgi:DNA-binding CsgD family transcriptional regulator
MPRLGDRDLRAVLGFLADPYAARSLDALTCRVNAGLRQLVPCDLAGYNEVNPGRRRIRYVLEPADADFPDSQQVFARHMHEHPIIAHYRRREDGRVLKFSDFLTMRRFRDLGLHREFYRRLGVEHVIIFPLPFRPPLQLGFCLNRQGRDFSERDRDVLTLLAPHIAGAYRNAEAVEGQMGTARWLEAGFERADRGLIVLGPDGRARVITERARRWLAEYWGAAPPQRDGLPAPVRAWIRREHGGRAGHHPALPAPRAPLVAERAGTRLVARLISDGGAALVVLEEQRTVPDARALAALGLTRREAEVLAWVAEGKTNAEIGGILGLSSRTVGKHLERVYAKLGVETRTAAARIALSAPRG